MAFDATKPTIDQTRAAAIDAIQKNFAALSPLFTSGVTSFNTRNGAVTLNNVDVTTALGYFPVNRAGDTMTGGLTAAALLSNTWVAVVDQTAPGTLGRRWMLTVPNDILYLQRGGGDWVQSWSGVSGWTAFATDVRVGIGVTPRSPGGNNVRLDISGTGAQRVMLQSSTAGETIRFISSVGGVFFDHLYTDSSANISAVASPSLIYRFTNPSGVTQNYWRVHGSGLIQVGDYTGDPLVGQNNSYGAAIGSSIVYFGLITAGTIDFRTAQTISCLPGSSITAILMAYGQVGRILVVGNGTITLPASVKTPRGGPLWGAAYTIISLLCNKPDAPQVIFASFTPYD